MNAYDVITDRIISQLEAGTVPWRKPWGGAAHYPRNLLSKKTYRGVNVFLLACSDYSSPYWLTFKQAQELGGTVRKGEKSTPVVFWGKFQPKGAAPEPAPTDRGNGDDDSGDSKGVPFLRYYNVFNVAQCELPAEKIPAIEAQQKNAFEQIESAERIVVEMQQRPPIRHGFNSACYVPIVDEIRMPHQTAFDDAQHYYSTLFHELGHSTGHKSRLDRKGINEPTLFGTDPYGREELVAEMTAAFLCGRAGIETATLDNSAAYIANWLRVLKSDSKLVVTAAAQAQKAADFILNVKWTEQPARELAAA